MTKFLFVFTSANKTLTGHQTGWFLPEVTKPGSPAAHPYYRLAPHIDIDFAAPKGPNPEVDQNSVKSFTDDESVKFLNDPVVKSKLSSAKKLSEVNVDDYVGIFYIGGHGPVIDLPTDPENIKLANKFWSHNKIVSAVCHGPAALVNVTDPSGKSIFAGRKATAFSNAEEEKIDMVSAIPFLVENRIVELGGHYEKATELWEPKVIVDGKLITGQNPASAAPIGETILKALKA
ncbi:hypothetical protein Clacol_001801 [Clathrus columnatus]|uniref:D-lactate dehydratase n=1 Tax=Clathrus columnatus TaxID=1419009 RepID=A0AAV5A309_9AGAM|nr:hypothetical protein Clacol_001801 [Clathrus columnatus]